MKTMPNDLMVKIGQLFSGQQDENGYGGKNPSSVFLFFSVDLVNSTYFKTIHQSDWVPVFRDFYDIVSAQVIKSYINAKIWKYAGDEILFYVEAKCVDDVLRSPSVFYSAMKRAQAIFHNLHKFTECSLYMKGALWAAVASDSRYTSSFNAMSNIYTTLATGLDFVGVDIDEGFRMSKNTSQGKLVIDPKIVYLLNKYTDQWQSLTFNGIRGNVRFVGFEVLKGIWEGRAYPVIWYCDNWDTRDMFLYDEYFSNPFAKEYTANKDGVKEIGYITKIFKDLGFLYKKTDQIEAILTDTRIPVTGAAGAERKADLHSATICFDAANERVFIVKNNAEPDAKSKQFVYIQK
jgi:hypothetical protein